MSLPPERRHRRTVVVVTIIILLVLMALLALLSTRKVPSQETAVSDKKVVSYVPPDDYVWTPLYAREPVPVGGTDHPLADLSPGGVLTQMMPTTFDAGFVYDGKAADHAVFTMTNDGKDEIWSIAKWDTRRPYISFPVAKPDVPVTLKLVVSYKDGTKSEPITLR